MHKTDRSQTFMKRAEKVIPGGVNSPVRAFRSVGSSPIFIERGEGPFVYDVDGQRYLDYVGSWGPLILGHAHPAILQAIEQAARLGTSFGMATEREVELAERVTKHVPSVEKVRFVSSGTEATMSALRLARGFTGKDLVIKFSGCYHGHADAFLSDAGSGLATLGIPASLGVPAGTTADTITLPYNDLESVSYAFQMHANKIACVILEPIACNMGMVQPLPEFLKGLRALCDQYGALLIFDEVITGFRVALGGAQELFGIRPDLTTFGKIIGGGLPVGAYGGRADIMNCIAPLGGVYQAGTLSGNPLAMSAGIAMLDVLAQPGVYATLDKKAEQLVSGIQQLLQSRSVSARIDRVASIFYLWFGEHYHQAPQNYEDIKKGNTKVFSEFFNKALHEGVYFAPSAFEVGFVSLAHESRHIEQTLSALARIM